MAATNGKGAADTAVPINGDAHKEEVDFAKISIPEAFNVLKCTPKGLTSEEAKDRLDEYGPNKLPESTRNPVLIFLGYMWNPLSWAMEVAAIMSIALLDYADFALIVALLVGNAVISFKEEAGADKAIKALTAALAPKAKVLRDGKVETIDAVNLVPGDVVIIRLGDIVPADLKLLGEEGEEDHPMQVDQAALTGESMPVKKFTGATAFSGSAIKQGERHALVYATGSNTFFGRAAALIGSTHNVANVQKIMTRIGGTCLVTIFIWCIIELAVQFGHYEHSCHAGEDRCPTLTNMLVIVVGGIPIAMPTVLTVTLALGAYKLAKEGAIVARMSAVEEMAGMDILCSDKTGTLTLNKLSVDAKSVFPMMGHSVEETLKFGALSANIVTEEPIDMVMHESYPGNKTLWDEYEMVRFLPFNPTDKITVATVRDKATGKVIRVMKGAPQVILKKCVNAADLNTVGTAKITEYANRGFRGLGIAKSGEGGGSTGDWEMVGLIPLYDPPRHDTKETIERCIEKGISVKMVTGDQLLIGKETARQLGMGTNMYTTETLMKAKEGIIRIEGCTNVDELVEYADGFAEVFPEHKFEIVKILQDRHHMVGMTGDGVNDAPALKKADVGIAVAGATDAARGAADIVLTKPGLATIVTAIIGARKIFQRMTTYSKYTVAMTFRICFTFGLLTTIYNWYFPTILIVLLAVFNDGAMIALSKDRVVPSRLPNSWNLRSIFISGIVYGLYLTLSSWTLYYVATKTNFFEARCNLYSLNDHVDVLQGYCQAQLAQRSPPVSPKAPITDIPAYADQINRLPGSNPQVPSVLQQCQTEQQYVRSSIMRSLIYAQVSISGQALVFVVRTMRWSVASRAGLLTYIAFFLAQIGASVIAGIGFAGYPHPPDSFENCEFCHLTNGHMPAFFSGEVPIYNTESRFAQSVIGCTYYLIVAWVWSIIWYMGLDPIKWLLAFLLNEDGMRDLALHKKEQKEVVGRMERRPSEEGVVGFGTASYANPMGRVSIQRPSPAMLERASVVSIGRDRLDRVSQRGLQRESQRLQRESQLSTGRDSIGRMSAPIGGYMPVDRGSRKPSVDGVNINGKPSVDGVNIHGNEP
ncbi:hypothetical protein WJX72_007324 [[Myrmecia] bisecta]|uniref:Plasma membrane ATPase n=1 Tax=[Myrmecia] bisecta TaxID=41462 RepID=A0AAW1R7T3_9CHLO